MVAHLKGMVYPCIPFVLQKLYKYIQDDDRYIILALFFGLLSGQGQLDASAADPQSRKVAKSQNVGLFAENAGLKDGPFAENVSRTEGIFVGLRDYVCGLLQLHNVLQ
jgi:hypothetical protein